MTADTQIPEDIFQTACGIVMEAKSLKSMLKHRDVVDAIAAALAGERERCAQIARTFAWTIPTATSCDLDTHAERVACTVQSQIAAAIRGGA